MWGKQVSSCYGYSLSVGGQLVTDLTISCVGGWSFRVNCFRHSSAVTVSGGLVQQVQLGLTGLSMATGGDGIQEDTATFSE